jgi:hypothetical protein
LRPTPKIFISLKLGDGYPAQTAQNIENAGLIDKILQIKDLTRFTCAKWALISPVERICRWLTALVWVTGLEELLRISQFGSF